MNSFCNSALTILKSKKRHKFSIGKEITSFDAVTSGKMPATDEIFTLISVAQKETIEKMYCSTFRIGKNHFKKIYGAYLAEQIKDAEFYTSDMQSETDKGKYNYIQLIKQVCDETKWEIKSVKNHSKIILMETAKGNHYVVETSSNLNENPKIEQFSISNDIELFNFYRENLFELLKNA